MHNDGNDISNVTSQYYLQRKNNRNTKGIVDPDGKSGHAPPSSLTTDLAPKEEIKAGASIPPETMMHSPPVSDFPPILENVS